MFWQLKNPSIPTSPEELRSVLLANRRISETDRFFNPRHPATLSLAEVGLDANQVTTAIARLKLARDQHQRVLIFGDYDVDGISATAILWETVHKVGLEALPFIPHREKHGYGLSTRAVDEILAGEHPDLIVTVDNGIVAQASLMRLQAAGIDTIVTDHHQPEDTGYPPSVAVVHSTQLCGATVAWFFAREIWQQLGQAQPARSSDWGLDLAALATVADQVPLVNANREFVWYGLQALRDTKRVGLQFLMKWASVTPGEVSTNTINYALAPRINAMGRLAHGLDALRLLCTTNRERAEQLAQTLSSTNIERQELTQQWLAEAQSQAEAMRDEHILIMASPQYHEGVIGLLAGRLMEQFSKPTIVMAIGETHVKASARSIPQVNIVELLRQVRHDLLEVGGHPMAAGFSVLPEKIETVTAQLQGLAKTQIAAEWLVPGLELECEVPSSLLQAEVADELQRFAPFGAGNRLPVFAWQAVGIESVEVFGTDRQHLRLKITAPGLKYPITALAWNKAEWATKLTPNQVIDLAGSLEWNEWRGRRSLQLMVKDIKV